MLAHDAALLGVSVDATRLFDGTDPYYEVWLGIVVDKVHETRRRSEAQARREQESG